MDRLTVQSSVIYSVGYSAKKGDLEVQMLDGSVYLYLAVPAAVYLEFMHAESADTFYDSKVKNQYVFRKSEPK